MPASIEKEKILCKQFFTSYKYIVHMKIYISKWEIYALKLITAPRRKVISLWGFGKGYNLCLGAKITMARWIFFHDKSVWVFHHSDCEVVSVALLDLNGALNYICRPISPIIAELPHPSLNFNILFFSILFTIKIRNYNVYELFEMKKSWCHYQICFKSLSTPSKR